MEEDIILKKINEAISAEEFIVPVYSAHLQSALFWSGIEEEKQKFFIENLKKIAKTSELHAKILEKIKSLFLNKI